MTGGPLSPTTRFALAGFDVRRAMLQLSDGKTDQPDQIDIVLCEDGRSVALWLYRGDASSVVSFVAFDAPVDPATFDAGMYRAILDDRGAGAPH